jgi:hypothetical protein
MIACTHCIYEYFDFNFSMTLVFLIDVYKFSSLHFQRENYEELFPILYLS